MPRLGASDFVHVRGLLALATFDDIELDPVTFCQAAVAVALNGREVNEHVLPRIALDETEPLGGIEPFDRPLDPSLGRHHGRSRRVRRSRARPRHRALTRPARPACPNLGPPAVLLLEAIAAIDRTPGGG